MSPKGGQAGMAEDQADRAWHAMEPQEAMAALGTRAGGLSQTEATDRLRRFGPNRLPEKKPPSPAAILGRQFLSPLIYILMAAAALAAATGDISDALFIAVVLGINAIIGASQEWKAERSNLALRQLLRVNASVEREGRVREIPAEQVVPGDIVWLESGNRVPADLRLLWAQGLELDESLLTGESLPVSKEVNWRGPAETTMGDRLNMAHAATAVARGRAKGVATATGSGTATGRLAASVQSTDGGRPPLLERMDRFTRVLAVVVLGAAGAIGAWGVLAGGHGLRDMFLFGVALAVSAIPEGLPIAMTVVLAVATARMAGRGVVVRRLAAVEGLGSCTLIATDKTGTLTCNELTVRQVTTADGEVYDVTGEGFAPIGAVTRQGMPIDPAAHAGLIETCRVGVLCNEAELHARDGTWAWRGDAVDVAMLSLGYKVGLAREAMLDNLPQVNQIPFEPERRFAATHHREGDAVRVAVKGAPEKVLGMCDLSERPGLVERVERQAAELAGRGYRVLALARGRVGAIEPGDLPGTPTGLEYLGLAAMMDPLRPGAAQAVAACACAGVRVCMVTGDHRLTALAIARQLGMADRIEQVVSGAELEGLDDAALGPILERARVFARVSPADKLRIVRAARGAGHFVAVTGDGVNDAPALRAANIGVAMGRGGTDVARQASELVITDDNFATLVAGVEEGRVAYDNIRNVIYLLLSTGAAELLLMFLAILSGAPLPLLPVQLLWLNLVTNGIQDVALAFEPGRGDALARPPRPASQRIFDRLMIQRTLLAASVMSALGFGVFHVWLPPDPTDAQIAQARNALLLLLVLFENVHLGNCRSETVSLFRLSPLRSPVLLIGALAALALHLWAMHSDWGRSLLGVQPIPAVQWFTLVGLALTLLPVMELHKWWCSRRRTAEGGTMCGIRKTA